MEYRYTDTNDNFFMLWTNVARMVDSQPCSVLLLSDRM